MRILLRSLIFVILFCSLAFGQNSARRQRFDELKQVVEQIKLLKEERKKINDRQIEILLKLKEIAPEDAAAAAKLGAKAIRLFPCCALDEKANVVDGLYSADIPWEVEVKLKTPGTFSAFLVTELTRTKSDNMIEGANTFEYANDLLKVISRRDHGFILDLGQTPFEYLDENTKEAAALAEYRPPTDEKEVKPEFFAGGINFRLSAPATVGNSYLLRAVKYNDPDRGVDTIYALKIYRRDANGSIIIFIKPVKVFDPPTLKDPDRERGDEIRNLGIAAKLKEEFRAKGFNEIEIEVSGFLIVTLKGSVPFGRKEEAIAIAKNLTDFIKVKDELTEK